MKTFFMFSYNLQFCRLFRILSFHVSCRFYPRPMHMPFFACYRSHLKVDFSRNVVSHFCCFIILYSFLLFLKCCRSIICCRFYAMSYPKSVVCFLFYCFLYGVIFLLNCFCHFMIIVVFMPCRIPICVVCFLFYCFLYGVIFLINCFVTSCALSVTMSFFQSVSSHFMSFSHTSMLVILCRFLYVVVS